MFQGEELELCALGVHKVSKRERELSTIVWGLPRSGRTVHTLQITTGNVPDMVGDRGFWRRMVPKDGYKT